MAKQVGRFLFWTPRILSMLFILLLALMSLDVFELKLGFWPTLLALLLHLIPAIILAIVLIIAWKHEIVGGIAFLVAGIAYIGFVLDSALKNTFEWYLLSWTFQISGVAFLIGILFLVGWSRKKR
ncbi:MAG: hypothetical protein V1735_07935 [Nanoarchaeota archaeon]